MIALNITGISIIAFFILFILNKRDKQLGDFFLMGLNLMLIGLLASDIWIRQSINAGSFIFQIVLSFYLAPVFIWYGLVTLSGGKRLKFNWLWVGIFAFAFTVFIFLDFAINQYTRAEVEGIYYDAPLRYHFFYKIHKIFNVVAILWFLSRLRKYQGTIRDQYSFIEPVRYLWLRNYSWAVILIYSLSFFVFIFYNLGLFEGGIEVAFIILNSSVVAAMFYLCFMGVRQYIISDIYARQLAATEMGGATQNGEKKQLEVQQAPLTATNDFEKEERKEENSASKSPNSRAGKSDQVNGSIGSSTASKYRTSSLTASEMETLHEKLVDLFEAQAVYKEPKLQLKDVAAQLLVTPHHLSQTINSVTAKPFYDFVNQYRVAHLKQLLSDPTNKQYTILALGMESGFNSKASLNRIFKQATGATPRDFQKAHLPE